MIATFKGIELKSIYCAVPKNIVDLENLSSVFGEGEVKKIINATGIRSIRIADKDKTTSDYGYLAAAKLLEDLNICSSTIDGLIFVSQTPDYITPATSHILQHRLRLPKTSVVMDINQGCNGYIIGLYLASMLLTCGGCTKILLIVGDTLTRFINELDKSLKFVLGDAVCATLIEKGNKEEKIIFGLGTDGSRYDKLIISAGGCRMPISKETKKPIKNSGGNVRTLSDLYMDGVEIMTFSIREIPPLVNNLLRTAGFSKDDIKFYLFHQANKFIVNYVGKVLHLKEEQVPIAINGFGNTSGCSMPLLITQKYEELSNKNRNNLEKVMLIGFGVGLSWGGCLLSLKDIQATRSIEV